MKACLKLQPDVLFQRIPANFKIKSTAWEIYIKLYYKFFGVTQQTTLKCMYIGFFV